MTHSNLCEITLPGGRDCSGRVPQDAPFAICWDHLKCAAEFVSDVSGKPSGLERERIPLPCPKCDRLTVWRATGADDCHCDCGFEVKYADIREAAERALARLPQERVVDRTSVVYFIRFADRIKIGTTTNQRQRLAGLPHDEVLAITPGDVSTERTLHTRFRHLRVTGEWFKDDPDIRQFISRLKRNGEVLGPSR